MSATTSTRSCHLMGVLTWLTALSPSLSSKDCQTSPSTTSSHGLGSHSTHEEQMSRVESGHLHVGCVAIQPSSICHVNPTRLHPNQRCLRPSSSLRLSVGTSCAHKKDLQLPRVRAPTDCQVPLGTSTMAQRLRWPRNHHHSQSCARENQTAQVEAER